MYVVDHFPPSKQVVVMRDLPVANSWPIGHENMTAVPKAVSLLDANAPNPDFNGGQSENSRYTNINLRKFIITKDCAQ